jgi:hypothetical protein
LKKHCFKCNSFQPQVGGALVLTGNRRRRFACAACLPKISNRPVLLYVAKPKDDPAAAAA